MIKAKVFIPLTQGQVTMIDYDDYNKIKQYKWYSALKKPNKFYVKSLNNIRLHRIITNCPKGMVVDHIDGNGLNNCRNNLRICTNSQNIMNSKKRKDNKSGYKGVRWEKDRNRWSAKININKKQIRIGSFSSAKEAYNEYCKFAELYYKEFKNIG